jgi:enoyl-CoA hydratase
MDQPTVITERRDRVLLIELNRPESRNAIDLLGAELLAAALAQLDADPGLHVAVISGRGGHFCSGHDLQAFLAGERAEIPGRGFAGLVEAPPQKPLIAAVEGAAIGGGFEIVLSSDLVVASSEATFSCPELERGLVPTGGALIRLPRLLPGKLAAELVLTGRSLSAAEAERLSVVNRLVAPGEALDAALALASEIAAKAPLATRASSRVLREAAGLDEAAAFALQRRIVAPVLDSDDAAEGARAFVEKRPPRWQGR